jgi:hypothetical protein
MKTLLFSKRIILPLVMVLTVFGLVATWLPSEAQAHGRKTIVNGKYQIVFGLLNEPVYVGNQSGVDLTVCVGTCENRPSKPKLSTAVRSYLSLSSRAFGRMVSMTVFSFPAEPVITVFDSLALSTATR